MTEKRKEQLKRRLVNSRRRLSNENTYFAEPLFDMDYIATKSVWRISASEKSIFFDPDWLQRLDDTALDFILSHELMHIALGHIYRPLYYKGDRFHLAADIVVNSKLEFLGMTYEELPKIGKLYHETFYPKYDGKLLTSLEAFKCVPFDPARERKGSVSRYMIDSDKMWGEGEKCEDGVLILSSFDKDLGDEVSKIKNGGRIFFKKEFPPKKRLFVNWSDDEPESKPEKTDKAKHPQGYLDPVELSRQLDALRDTVKAENIPFGGFTERLWQANDPSRTDWRRLLHTALQEDIIDYTFSPPDKRFGDSDVFLPDFALIDRKPRKVLFMADTSGSISDEMLGRVFSEIKGAISQFESSLRGILGFFDAAVYPLTEFNKVSELRSVRPPGGGGTDYFALFDFIRKNFTSDSVSDIVIFTDGEADFPDGPPDSGIPVLWLFSKENVSAPWGRQAVVK